MTDIKELIDRLYETASLTPDELKAVLSTDEYDEYLHEKAREVAVRTFGKDIYLRGIIEFSNYCKNDCYYCGIRADNTHCERYRMTVDDIIRCADSGYETGFRTFVLQSGEDLTYKTEDICRMVRTIKENHPDCAVTLSIGEKSREEYQAYFDAGCDRYLLRHETYNSEHYKMLHPDKMSWLNRIRCLHDIKDIGYQTGCGIMVGTPGQTLDHIVEDLVFMKEFDPHMIGIGPFLPAANTPFADCPRGDTELTLRLLSVIRLMLPKVLLPATTALGSAEANGREKGVLAGANVIMPNLSPVENRGKYQLYDGKICISDDAALCSRCITARLASIGYRAVTGRGDHPDYIR